MADADEDADAASGRTDTDVHPDTATDTDMDSSTLALRYGRADGTRVCYCDRHPFRHVHAHGVAVLVAEPAYTLHRFQFTVDCDDHRSQRPGRRARAALRHRT